MNTLISVIIPNYNGGEYLKESIESAINQKNVSVEVIVVDDGSNDNSLEILNEYEGKILILNQKHKGAPSARNLGLKSARGEFIKFLDADDVLLPGVLFAQSKQLELIKSNEIIYGQAVWTDVDLNPIKGYTVSPIKENQNPIIHILTQNPLTAAPLHRKKLIENIGGFDESLIKGQEFDLHLRLVLNGVRFIYQDLSIYLFRQGNSDKRISFTSFKNHHEKLFQMLQKQEYMVLNSTNNHSTEIYKVLGKRYLTFGKRLIIEGNLWSSLNFFLRWFKLVIK